MTLRVLDTTENPSLAARLAALLEHVDCHELPEPASLTWNRSFAVLEMQPHHAEPVALTTELLRWAESLTGPVVELVPVVDRKAHLSVAGLTGAGIPVRLYTRPPAWLTARHQGPLDAEERVSLSLSVLRSWAVAESGVIH
ncbi:hypothetical protein J2S53_003126 [Actinopolyspora lacussalsi]|nr:hypothetical protein [Actinopolyspora lacussalsi]